MNKKELIDQISQGADLTKAQAEQAINALTDAVTKELATGGSIALTGFGTFQVKERAARTGRNPQTGETIQIPAKTVLKFRIAKAAKDAVL